LEKSDKNLKKNIEIIITNELNWVLYLISRKNGKKMDVPQLINLYQRI
jgi:hypothetical protein